MLIDPRRNIETISPSEFKKKINFFFLEINAMVGEREFRLLQDEYTRIRANRVCSARNIACYR